MKYVSLKQRIKNNALLCSIVIELEEIYGFSRKYNVTSFHNVINFEYSLKSLSYGEACHMQELAVEFTHILMEKAITYPYQEDISETASVCIKEYKEYPGATKPYFAEVRLPDDHKITLLHVHYYQSLITKTAKEYHNTSTMFEDSDTIYYDVKNGHIICYPLNIDGNYKKNESFWGKYDAKNKFFVTDKSCTDDIYYLHRQKRFLQYYKMFHPQD